MINYNDPILQIIADMRIVYNDLVGEMNRLRQENENLKKEIILSREDLMRNTIEAITR